MRFEPPRLADRMCWIEEPKCHNVAIHFRLPDLAAANRVQIQLREALRDEEHGRRKRRSVVNWHQKNKRLESWLPDGFVKERRSKRNKRNELTALVFAGRACLDTDPEAFARSGEAWNGTACFLQRNIFLGKPGTVDEAAHFRYGKTGNNFFTCRGGKEASENVSYVIFPGSGDVIVTGLSNERSIRPVLRDACMLFGYSSPSVLSCTTPRIVNSTWGGAVICRHFAINGKRSERSHWAEKDGPAKYMMEVMGRYSAANKNNPDLCCCIRSSFFPGVKLRHQKLRGTINFFSSGRYVMVGITNRREALRLHAWLSAIMRRYWMTREVDSPCAFFAGSYSPISLVDEEDCRANSEEGRRMDCQ